jgi:signal peptidase II
LEVFLKKKIIDYGILFGIAGILIVLDQWTKALVRTSIPLGGSWAPDWLMPFARFVHWNNTGVAFGMFQGNNDFFKILAIVITVVIIYYYPRVPSNDWYIKVAMGMQLGGALGNLIDRFIRGEVTDFISVGNFAVFNIADASISTGVAVLLLGMWIKERHEKPLKQDKLETDQSPENSE